MYLIIRLAQHLDTPNIVDGRWIALSETPVIESNEIICIDPADYPAIFTPSQDSPLGYTHTLIEGFDNAPQYTWNTATREFVPYTGFEQDIRIQAYRRREEAIQPEILYTIKPGTEFKKIRKCLKAIIAATPQLSEIPEVLEFLSYSDAIEAKISIFEKAAPADGATE